MVQTSRELKQLKKKSRLFRPAALDFLFYNQNDTAMTQARKTYSQAHNCVGTLQNRKQLKVRCRQEQKMIENQKSTGSTLA